MMQPYCKGPPILTAKMALAAIQRDALALQDVPYVLVTTKLCLVAVQLDGNALICVPAAFR